MDLQRTTFDLSEGVRTPPDIGKTVGSNSLGPYPDFEVSSASGRFDARLQQETMSVDWVEGTTGIFQLKMIQDATGGLGAFKIIKGYASTPAIVAKVNFPGYIHRVARLVRLYLPESMDGSLGA